MWIACGAAIGAALAVAGLREMGGDARVFLVFGAALALVDAGLALALLRAARRSRAACAFAAGAVEAAGALAWLWRWFPSAPSL